jgi:hypothetical protein
MIISLFHALKRMYVKSWDLRTNKHHPSTNDACPVWCIPSLSDEVNEIWPLSFYFDPFTFKIVALYHTFENLIALII